jgi:hypothetical protein
MEATYLYSDRYNEAVKITEGNKTLVVASKSATVSISTGTSFSVNVYRTALDSGMYKEVNKEFFETKFKEGIALLHKIKEA